MVAVAADKGALMLVPSSDGSATKPKSSAQGEGLLSFLLLTKYYDFEPGTGWYIAEFMFITRATAQTLAKDA